MKRFIILALTLSVSLSACNDALDKEPLDKITQYDYFKNATDLELFTNPFYNNLLDKEPFDEHSDLLVQNTLSAYMYGGGHRVVPSSGGGWTWTDLRRMNTLLKYADQCEDKDAVEKYSAIARFYRAFFYFNKVKTFGDVPWYEEELGSADEALYKPRDSRELVMSKMIEDIDYASEKGRLTESATPYRVNRWAALTLKAQFCLFEGTYRKYHGLNLEGNDYNYYLTQAAEAAKEVIENGPYRLYSTKSPSTDYMMLFAQENASVDEYILAIKFDYALGIRHNASAYTLLPTQGRPGLTRKFINTYLMSDGTAFTDQVGWQTMQFKEEVMNRDPRLAQSIRTPGYKRIGQSTVLAPQFDVTVTGYQPIKFVQDPTSYNGNNDRVDSSACDIPVYRFAEVLLIYAEAMAELGTLTQIDVDMTINKLRDRVGMPHLDMAKANANPDWYLSSEDYGYPNVSGTNKGVILEIRRERTIEMLQEGLRLEDLARWKAGPCIDQPITGMYFPGPGTYDLSGEGAQDLILYANGSAKPTAGNNVQVYEIGKDILLSDDSKGYVNFHKNVERTKFNEERDYLYPIPINERSLNPNLTQNPGWNDGLNF
jgi:hypothetical protein